MQRYGRSVLRVSLFAVLLAASYIATTGLLSWRAEARVYELVQCFSASSFGVPLPDAACMEEKVPPLLDTFSPGELLTMVTGTSSPQTLRGNCHPVAHVVGKHTYEQTKNLEAALASCPYTCSGGCIHGAIGTAVADIMGENDEEVEHTSVAKLKELGQGYCDRNLSLCHAVGHLLFINTESYETALDGCADISSGFAEEACYQGVFMESAGSTESLNLTGPIIPGVTSHLASPCIEQAPEHHHACFQFLPVYQLYTLQPKGIVAPEERLSVAIETCAALDGRTRSYCFEGVGVSWNLFSHLRRVELPALCSSLPLLDDQLSCDLGIQTTNTSRVRWNNAMHYCNNVPEENGRRHTCVQIVLSALNRAYADDQLQTQCARMNPNCTANVEDYLSHKNTVPDFRFGIYGEVK